MASVRKRVTGRGASVWDVRYRDNRGRPRSRTFKRAEDARIYAKTVEADLVRGDFLDPAKGRRKFDEFADQWLASCSGLKPKTIVGYTSMLNRHVLPAFSGLAIAKIERSDVREFLGQLGASGMAPGTVRSARKGTASRSRDDGRVRRHQAEPVRRRPRRPLRARGDAVPHD